MITDLGKMPTDKLNLSNFGRAGEPRVKTNIANFITLLGCVVFFFALTSYPSLSSAADDPDLFLKDGFLIHFVGNGGNCNACEWIAVDGKIPPDAGDLFKQYIIKRKLQDPPQYVTINSTGGSLRGGILLGRAIRSFGFDTSVGKTVPDGNTHYDTTKGICYSACAYAFLGGVNRLVDEGEYGVHQFYTSALLKDPNGKVFSPIDFSAQQALTGLLLTYLVEMGVSTDLVIEANKTAPHKMNILSKSQLAGFHVAYDPKRYGRWKLEPYRNGLISYSRTQDRLKQMTLYCDKYRRSKLLVTFKNPIGGHNNFRNHFNIIKKFSLLNLDINRAKISLEDRTTEIILRVPLTNEALDALEKNKDPIGSFSVHSDEPRSNLSLLYEKISLNGLTASVRLIRKNCIK